ncbi:MAG TPA: GatB/YqeY domain-containing protein, partial [Capillimicrobium sp.]
DYRYFPEPDLVPISITSEMLDAARAELPELPAARAERYMIGLGLSEDSAKLLAGRVELADYFEAALSADGAQPQTLANWVAELAARLDEGDPGASRVEPAALARLVGLLSSKAITQAAARQVLDRLVAEGGDPQAIVDAEGLGAIGGGDELAPIVAEAIAANQDAAEKIKAGNMKAIGAIIGHVMKATKGRADGGEVTRLVREQLGL